jgi:hypothetical protein
MNRKSSHRRNAISPDRRITAALAFICLLGAAACATARTYLADSRWPKNPIKIDGKSDDWRGALAFVDEGELSLGFHNDQDNLYLCLLVANDMMRNQIMRGGLTVWFDSKGGKEKSLGIKFPLGGRPDEFPMDGPPIREGAEDNREERPSPPEGAIPPEGALDELEIIRAGKDAPERVKLEKMRGLEVKVEAETGLLVYELKIPLLGDGQTAVAIGAKPGTTVGIGFETSKLKLGGRNFGGRGPGGTPPGGMGLPPMGGRRGGFGGRGMGNFDLPKPLKIWAFVKLSSGATGASPGLESLENKD